MMIGWNVPPLSHAMIFSLFEKRVCVCNNSLRCPSQTTVAIYDIGTNYLLLLFWHPKTGPHIHESIDFLFTSMMGCISMRKVNLVVHRDNWNGHPWRYRANHILQKLEPEYGCLYHHAESKDSVKNRVIDLMYLQKQSVAKNDKTYTLIQGSGSNCTTNFILSKISIS